MMMNLLVDENAMRLFTDENWIRLRKALESRGFSFHKLPMTMHGHSDSELMMYIIQNNLDGIITEDNDFVETNRYALFNDLMRHNKEIYLVRRVPSTSLRYELRLYRYANRRKQFVLTIKPDGTVSSDPNY